MTSGPSPDFAISICYHIEFRLWGRKTDPDGNQIFGGDNPATGLFQFRWVDEGF